MIFKTFIDIEDFSRMKLVFIQFTFDDPTWTKMHLKRLTRSSKMFTFDDLMFTFFIILLTPDGFFFEMITKSKPCKRNYSDITKNQDSTNVL
jgi:hypothetical protein